MRYNMSGRGFASVARATVAAAALCFAVSNATEWATTAADIIMDETRVSPPTS